MKGNKIAFVGLAIVTPILAFVVFLYLFVSDYFWSLVFEVLGLH